MPTDPTDDGPGDGFRAMMAQMDQNPRANELDAAGYVEAFTIPAEESRMQGEIYRRAAEGTLSFDPIENVRAFARTADNLQGQNRVGDIAVALPEGVGAIEDVAHDDMLKVVQQARFARSLGFGIHGVPRIRDGAIMLRITGPDSQSGVPIPDDVMPYKGDHGRTDKERATRTPARDKHGNEIPRDITQVMRAGKFMEVNASGGFAPGGLENAFDQILQHEPGGRVALRPDVVDVGGAAYYGKVAEALGYHVGDVEQSAASADHFELPLESRRPGFEPKVQPVVEQAQVVEQAPEPANEAYIGPIKDLRENPILGRYLSGEQLTGADRDEFLKEAKREALIDGSQNKVILDTDTGSYWGAEHPNIFTFDGILRGNFEESIVDNPSVTDTTQSVAGPGGESTHVMIETDDGEKFIVRRTSGDDVKSASRQTFDLISTATRDNEGKPTVRQISTDQLRGVVAFPGEQLQLSLNAEGKVLKTRGKIARITSIVNNDEGRVASNHPYLARAERRRNTVQRFNEALKAT